MPHVNHFHFRKLIAAGSEQNQQSGSRMGSGNHQILRNGRSRVFAASDWVARAVPTG